MVDRNPFDELTEAEHKVAERLAQGRENKQIAQDLVMAEGTVKTHIRDIYQKLRIEGGRVEFGRLWERWHQPR